MVKVRTISRSDLEWTKDRSSEIPRAYRNFDSQQNLMSKQTEYSRAIRAAKLDRMFAKPFVSSLSGHTDTIQSIAVDPTLVSCIVTGAADGELYIWDTIRNKAKSFIKAHRHSIEDVVISPDGVACFSASRDKTIRMWDMDISLGEIKPVAEYLGKSPFSSIDHNYKKSEFITSGNEIELWDVKRTKPIQVISWGEETANFCRFNKVEVDLFAACLADRGVFVYDTRTRSGHTKFILEMQCTSVSWSPIDPNLFVVGCNDWNAYLFDMRMPTHPRSVFQGHVSAITSVDFSPTGTHFCAGSTDNTIRIWNISQHVKSDSEEIFHTTRMAKIYSVKWSLDNNYIFSGSEDAILRIWKADSSKPIRPLQGPEKNNFNYMRSLKKKYEEFPEVKVILKQRNLPKYIKKKRVQANRIQKREKIKEMSRKRSDNVKPLTKKKNVQTIK